MGPVWNPVATRRWGRSGQLVALVVAVVALAGAAWGCGGGGEQAGDVPSDAPDAPVEAGADAGNDTPPTTEAPLEAGEVRYAYEPVVGDCFDRRRLEADEGGGRVVLVVDCDLPHTFEVFEVFQLSPTDLDDAGDGAWPGEDALARVARLRCPGPFAGWVGEPYETSVLELGWVVPDEDRWADGIRTVACTVYDPGGDRLVGTAEGSGS